VAPRPPQVLHVPMEDSLMEVLLLLRIVVPAQLDMSVLMVNKRNVPLVNILAPASLSVQHAQLTRTALVDL
jgi:hypothetical protein